MKKEKWKNLYIILCGIGFVFCYAYLIICSKTGDMFWGSVPKGAVLVAMEILFTLAMTVMDYKFGGKLATILLGIALGYSFLGMLRTRDLSIFAGLVTSAVGLAAVLLICAYKKKAAKIYNSDSLAIKSISASFTAMYFLDLKKDEYSEYSSVPDVREAVGKTGTDIRENLRRGFEKMTDPDQMESLLEFVNIDTLSERIKGQKYIRQDFHGPVFGWCSVAIYPVKHDEDGQLIRALLGIQQVDEYRKRELIYRDKLRYQASYDELTGILNRNGFFEAVGNKLEKNKDTSWLVVCLDIKNFRVVNELFGQVIAEKVLRNIAAALSGFHRESAVCGRIYGDRFAVLMQESDFTEGEIVDLLKPLTKLENESSYHMHIHAGVYHVTDPFMEISVMCDRAIEAIATVKENLQQVVVFYDQSMGDKRRQETEIINEVDNAIETGQFKMFLQPQVTCDGTLLGGEALVRWFHPEKGMIPPAMFIPVLEQSGQIIRMDQIIWEEACKRLKAWKDAGYENLHISVNISPKDFYFYDLYRTFTNLVEQYGINPDMLKLEITETVLMTEAKDHLDVLKKLRAYGFTIEIDDFGSGYSSLNTLGEMEVDVLKLDLGFLRKAERDEKSKTILGFVLKLAKSLNLVTVSEGVEQESQVEYLRDAGCDVLQGYYFSKPLPVDEFEQKYGITF